VIETFINKFYLIRDLVRWKKRNNLYSFRIGKDGLIDIKYVLRVPSYSSLKNGQIFFLNKPTIGYAPKPQL
jgi:hypothetical protein